MLAQLLSYSICLFLIASDGRLIIIMSDIRRFALEAVFFPGGNDQDAQEGKVGKGDSGKISTSTKGSIPGATQQSKNDNLSATISSAVENQRNRNLSRNVKQISKRFPGRDYKLIQKVEEKVVQEKSIRTGSPRRRKATLLHFAPTNELPDVARVQLLLSNISERPLQFKLKSEPGALPSSKGHIDAHGSAKCTLTWRREANVEKWSNAQQPKMLLILDFLRDKMKDEKHTMTRLIGKVVSGQTCDSDKPPVEQLMLDAVTNEYFRSMSKEPLILEQAHTPKKETEREKNEAVEGMEGIVNNIADWLSQQSKNSLLGLFMLMIFFYFLGTLNSSKRKQQDE
ncbi:unnamed protein product [Cercopithifilaria johnstoni]|uniref:MSP domain-containing protein n=1 Tax=Cercopithifilaria johnstoni TaxID=2874296 RepID=A0A8J2Q389_9BILA|nr:unnamed protein product [Cercopithifilaria johnstoni]